MTGNDNDATKFPAMNADTRIRRAPERGGHDFDTVCAILDAGKVCHTGFTLDGQPYVVPMAYARDGDRLLLHGSVASRLMQRSADGIPVCVTVTHLDGLVLARSAFHSSMNYRSAMVFGRARAVTDEVEKARALDTLVEHLLPGRLAETRASTRKELKATLLLTLPIETFSTKVRTGPPDEPSADVNAPVWAGVVPLSMVAGAPEDAPDLADGLSPPDYLSWL